MSTTTIATPSASLQTLGNAPIDLLDGHTRVFRRVAKLDLAVFFLGREFPVGRTGWVDVEVGPGRRATIPGGTRVRVVAIETTYREDEDSSYETWIVEDGHRILCEVL